MTRGKVTPGDIAKVRKRHPNIEQEGLFDGPEPKRPAKSRTAAGPRSVAYAPCPEHPIGSMVGLVLTGVDTYAFRDHSRRIGKVTVPCMAPAREYDGRRFAKPGLS